MAGVAVERRNVEVSHQHTADGDVVVVNLSYVLSVVVVHERDGRLELLDVDEVLGRSAAGLDVGAKHRQLVGEALGSAQHN